MRSVTVMQCYAPPSQLQLKTVNDIRVTKGQMEVDVDLLDSLDLKIRGIHEFVQHPSDCTVLLRIGM